MSNPPTLTTARLILKPLVVEHADDYQKNFADYEVVRYLSDQVPWPYPEGGAKWFIENVILPVQGETRWAWGIFLKSAPDECVGAVDLWRDGVPEHRGFWLARRHWGNGYMAEACDSVTDFAFEQLGFEELVFSNALGNERSARIKEKAGAEPIGTRPAGFVDPQFTTSQLWRLTREAWNQAKSTVP